MKRTNLWLVAGLLLIISMAACGGRTNRCSDEAGCVSIGPGEPIRLAEALAFGDASGTPADTARQGVELALLERGEVLGHAVKLVSHDGGCSADDGQQAAKAVVSDTLLVAVIGHGCSSACAAAAPIYSKAGLLMVSPLCTAPDLTAAARSDYFFRTCPNAAPRAELTARFFAGELGVNTAAIIHSGSDLTLQSALAFRQAFEALGGRVTAEQPYGPELLSSLSVQVPELLFFPVPLAEGALIAGQARTSAGLGQVFLAGGDRFSAVELVATGGSASEGVYLVSTDDAPGSEWGRFDARYQARFGKPAAGMNAAYAYDATMMVLRAIEASAVQDRDGTLHIGRQALREAFAVGGDYAGASGTLRCDLQGDCAASAAMISQIQNGQGVVVWTP